MSENTGVNPRQSRRSFKRAMWKAVHDSPKRITRIQKMRLRVACIRPSVIDALEEFTVKCGIDSGSILPGEVDGTGLLVGDWETGSFFDTIIENLPAILDFIKQLLAIFSMFMVLLALGLSLIS